MIQKSYSPFFSVVTPSYNMLGYLKRCCASVADQEGASFEHIVVDAISDDGTGDWLKTREDINGIVEKDSGMYDAVNKGWSHARGEVLSYLNCDEQYLPGTLEFIQEYMTRHPDVDILFGDCLLTRPDGSLISYRKGYSPRWPYILASHLYVLSCTMFLRRRIFDDGYRFDDKLKDVGDQDFVVRLLRGGYRAAHARRYLSTFTMTGRNMSAGENAARETAAAWAAAPFWIRALKHPLNFCRLVTKVLGSAYTQKMPLTYAVFASGDASGRTLFEERKASFRWKTQ